VCKNRWKHVRPSCRGRVGSARAPIGRRFVSGREGTFVRQLRGRYPDEEPFVRCLDESWALKAHREGKDGGSLAEAGFAGWGVAGDPAGG